MVILSIYSHKSVIKALMSYQGSIFPLNGGINLELAFVCKLSEVSEGKLTSVDVEGVQLMVTKLGDDYIVSSRICTHKYYDLSKGHYSDGYVTCMLHTSVFDLSDEGDAMNPPATESLEMYPTHVKGEDLFIEI